MPCFRVTAPRACILIDLRVVRSEGEGDLSTFSLKSQQLFVKSFSTMSWWLTEVVSLVSSSLQPCQSLTTPPPGTPRWGSRHHAAPFIKVMTLVAPHWCGRTFWTILQACCDWQGVRKSSEITIDVESETDLAFTVFLPCQSFQPKTVSACHSVLSLKHQNRHKRERAKGCMSATWKHERGSSTAVCVRVIKLWWQNFQSVTYPGLRWPSCGSINETDATFQVREI